MSRIGNPYDNAKAESFMKTLKQEEVDGRSYRNARKARQMIGSFIEEVYDRQRLHSAFADTSAGRVRSELAAVCRCCDFGSHHLLRARGTALIARIANCLNARSASRTTASPLRGKSLTRPRVQTKGIQAINAY
jgi:transposase InsO family protein